MRTTRRRQQLEVEDLEQTPPPARRARAAAGRAAVAAPAHDRQRRRDADARARSPGGARARQEVVRSGGRRRSTRRWRTSCWREEALDDVLRSLRGRQGSRQRRRVRQRVGGLREDLPDARDERQRQGRCELWFGRAVEVASRDEVTQAITSVHANRPRARLRAARAGRGPGAAPAGARGRDRSRSSATASHSASGSTRPMRTTPRPRTSSPSSPRSGRTCPATCASAVRRAAPAGSPRRRRRRPRRTGPGGTGSFAQLLAAELGGEAQVFAHNVLGHTESNPLARMFTADSAEGRVDVRGALRRVLGAEEVKRLRAEKAALLGSPRRTTSWSSGCAPRCGRTSATRSRRTSCASGPRAATSRPAATGASARRCSWIPQGTSTLLRADFQATWLDDATIKNDFKRVSGAPR